MYRFRYHVGPNVHVRSLFGRIVGARGLREGSPGPGALRKVSTSNRADNSRAPKPRPVSNGFAGEPPRDFIFPRAVHAPITYHPREILSGRSSPRMPCFFRSSDMRMYSPLMLTGPSAHATSAPILVRLPRT